MEPVKIKGGVHSDARGTLSFVNDFDFSAVKRFYSIHHTVCSVVRAWQGHKAEQKFFYVNRGRFAVCWVAIDNWDKPSENLNARCEVLDAGSPVVLCIPPGFANGIKALTPDSLLTVYSSFTLEESEQDRWSFNQDLWIDWSKLI